MKNITENSYIGLNAETTLTACQSHIKSKDLRDRIDLYLPKCIDDEKQYLIHAKNLEFYKFKSTDCSSIGMKREDLVGLYNNHFSKNRNIEYYNKIIKIETTCPYCEFGESTTLDHYMPKSKFPTLSITPLNLIPCCSRCNSKKGDIVASKDIRLINPIFDRFDEFDWLKVDIIEGKKLIAEYKINKNIPNEIYQILNYSFDKLDLFNRYQVRAATEIDYLADDIEVGAEYLETDNDENLIIDMMYKKELKRHGKNYWKTALYKALLNRCHLLNNKQSDRNRSDC